MTHTPAVSIPEVHYARSGDVAIAYQVVGEGAPDIVMVRGITGDLLSTWEQPTMIALFLRRPPAGVHVRTGDTLGT